MNKSKYARFDVTTLENEYDPLLTQTVETYIDKLELVQIKSDPETLALRFTVASGSGENFQMTFDRHSLTQGLKHFIEELEPSTEYLILKQLQELNKTLQKGK